MLVRLFSNVPSKGRWCLRTRRRTRVLHVFYTSHAFYDRRKTPMLRSWSVLDARSPIFDDVTQQSFFCGPCEAESVNICLQRVCWLKVRLSSCSPILALVASHKRSIFKIKYKSAACCPDSWVHVSLPANVLKELATVALSISDWPVSTSCDQGTSCLVIIAELVGLESLIIVQPVWNHRPESGSIPEFLVIVLKWSQPDV